MLPDLPEEIIELILSYAPDFRDNLKKCQWELLQNRPCFYKRVHAGFKPGISDSPTWHNFSNKNSFINVPIKTIMGNICMYSLKLHAIEITPERQPNDRHWHSRDMNLYYGWARMKDISYWNRITRANADYDKLSPGYY